LNPTQKILWGEGLFIRPQHFQQQDSYHEWRLSQAMRMLHPYAHGIYRVIVDPTALRTGMLRLLNLQMVFKDGEFFSAPTEDELPEPVPISEAMEKNNSSSAIFSVAFAPWRDGGSSNYAKTRLEAGTNVRYHKFERPVVDQFTDASVGPIASLKKSVQLVSTDDNVHLARMPFVKVLRNGNGEYEIDPTYIPSSLTIESSEAMSTYLRRILELLHAKVQALYGFHREPSKNIIEFRSGDVASFWLLHTASSAYASLLHLSHNPGLHPERLFGRLLELAGALMTFSKKTALSDLPIYNHDEPSLGFERLNEILRELLETVISTRYFAVVLNEVKPSFYQGRLDNQKITEASNLYLSVSCAMPAAELVDVVPSRFKIGAPDDVEKAVLAAMPCVSIVHLPQVPAAIPVRPGAYYFALQSEGQQSQVQLYKRMLKAQTLSLYIPNGFGDIKLELMVINP
jgi:type VI secretion system protein ImpJ